MNPVLLDQTIRRFPRILAECAKWNHDATRFQWLLQDGCMSAIVAEYRQITGKEHSA